MISKAYLLLRIQVPTLHYKMESKWFFTKIDKLRTQSYRNLPLNNQISFRVDMFSRTYMDPEHDR